MSGGDLYHPSQLMKNALVADRAFEELDESGDHWLTDAQSEDWEWTSNLARQLGLGGTWMRRDRSDLHGTLLWMLPEIQKLLTPWPPPTEPTDLLPITHGATEGLSGLQSYSMLLIGPEKWLRRRITTGTIAELPEKLQEVLEDALAGALSAMLNRWVQMDVRKLRTRRTELIKQQEKLRNPPAPIKATGPRRKPDPQALADLKADRRAAYTPPGKT